MRTDSRRRELAGVVAQIRRVGVRISALAAGICVAALTTFSSPAEAQVTLEEVASGLKRPVFLTHAGDARLFVVEQPGRILVLDPGRGRSTVFLDIRSRVGSRGNEQGLLSVAFHPRFAENQRFFVNYTDRDGATVVSSFIASNDGSAGLPRTESVLLRIDQPYSNHNGGQLKFGPDGLLYIGMGDGGSGGDPLGAGQDNSTLLGAMLRIDVDNGNPYGIPAGNPFVNGGGKAEIWASGLRNPWRFSFDRETGDLFIADVGQSAAEEVDFVPAGQGSGWNFGWNTMEGSLCYAQQNCARAGLVPPVLQYGRQEGCSVTGGYVYRGRRYAAMQGRYFFGDFCTGRIWSFARSGPQAGGRLEAVTRHRISSFGEDKNGELYVLDLSGGVYRMHGQ